MRIKDFEALLHISVVFNFIYAVSENFSKQISIFFALNFKEYAEKILSKYSTKVRDITGKGTSKVISKKAEKAFVELSDTLEFILDPEKYDLEYNLKFKGIYLFTGLYSIFILLISGLDEYLNQDKLYISLFVANVFTSLFFLYSFCLTLFKYEKPIKQSSTLTIFILIALSFIAQYNFPIFNHPIVPSINCTICFTVTLVLLSFPLHFLRVILFRIYIFLLVLLIRTKYKIAFDEIGSSINRLEEARAIINEYEDPDKRSK